MQITRENYYSFPAVSNSALTQLYLELLPTDVIVSYEDAFRLGILLDAMCLWPERVDYLNRKVIGTDYNYSPKEFDHYRKMRDSFLNNFFIKELITISELQKPFFNRTASFSYNGINFTMPCKNLFDGYMPSLNHGWDLKKTKTTDQRGFLQSVDYFSYHRQGAFYANNSNSKKHIIIGVSEINLKVFHVFMDAEKDLNGLWKTGTEEMNYLSFRHYMLKN